MFNTNVKITTTYDINGLTMHDGIYKGEIDYDMIPAEYNIQTMWDLICSKKGIARGPASTTSWIILKTATGNMMYFPKMFISDISQVNTLDKYVKIDGIMPSTKVEKLRKLIVEFFPNLTITVTGI